MRRNTDSNVIDETPPGGTPTPGEDVVDEIGELLGLTYDDAEVLRVGEKEHERDVHRWELDPASADDYTDPLRQKPLPAGRLRHFGHR